AIDALRITAELDGDLILRSRESAHAGLYGNAVGSDQFLADRIEQPPLQDLRHAVHRNAVNGLVLEWTGIHNRCLALRLDTLLNGLLDHSGRRPGADILPRFLAIRGWQAAQVSFDERFERCGIEAADEDKCEIARICETVLVKRERLIEIPFVDIGGRRNPPAQMVLSENRCERFRE